MATSPEDRAADDAASAVSLLRLTSQEADHFARRLLNERDLRFYLDAGQATLRSTLAFIHDHSRYVGVADDPLKIAYRCTDDLCFSAYVVPEAADAITIHVSMGTLWALQDAILRAFSSQNFFNALIGDHEYANRWRGCECRAPLDTFRPRVRYWDYAAAAYAPHPVLVGLWRDHGIPQPSEHDGPWIGRFTKKLPYDDGRLRLSALMLDIALAWITLHEEAHYRQGHLPYRMARTQGGQAEPLSADMLQAFEFQADKDATQGIVNVFFRPAVQRLLPPYASGDPYWVMRFLADAIGMVILVMDVGRRCDGHASSHPLPRVRFLAVMRHLFYFALRQTHQHVLRGFDWDDRLEGGVGESDLRSFHALGGALWDMTQLQQLVDAEEPSLILADPLWPFDDAFPFVANPVLYWGATSQRESPEAWSNILASAREMAAAAAPEFGVPLETARAHVDVAQQWVDDANALIESSNSRFRDLTVSFRLWEKP
jgi:hypothetical protein